MPTRWFALPPDFKQVEVRQQNDFHGKSEILLKITKPDSTDIILRDGYFHHFDPGNAPLITIPPKVTETFDVGWFFQNARGRWEHDDEVAKVFFLKGKYKIRILFRNVFPKAWLRDKNTGERKNMQMSGPERWNLWRSPLKSNKCCL